MANPSLRDRDFTGGNILGPTGRRTTSDFPDIDQRVAALVHEYRERLGSSVNEDLLEELVVSALRFAKYPVNSAELKLMTRSMKELRNAWRIFRPYDNRRKIAVYGSARTKPEEPEFKAAERFARRIVEEGFMVITGAGDGIMGAANKGAGRDNSFGLNIRLPFEQDANEAIAGDRKLANFNYFFTRKLTFVKEAEAIALFPGGFGTMDEGFEVLTLAQTGKTTLLPIVMVDVKGGSYWKTFEEFLRNHLLRLGLISEEDFSLFKVTDDIEEAVSEVKNFYRVFHSYRWHRNELIVRLQRPISEAALASLNAEFPDILKEGEIFQHGPVEDGGDDPNLSHLPRLILFPHKKRYGRLREFIDAINKAG